MSNEEKILSMLAAMQADIRKLQSDVELLTEKKHEDELAKLTPEERKARQLAALDAFQKSIEEDPEGMDEFFAFMKAEEERKAAAW